ncbi:MAG: response regulator transcription factor [Syntrophobacteria bacterium]
MPKTLLVEDNLAFRQALRELLAEKFPSMVIEEASDAHEALEKVSAFLPDLIFMDIKLRTESGLELTQSIKTEHADTVVIVLTGYDLPEYRTAAFRSGANHFLSKNSSSRQQILALVESVVSEKVTG